MKLIAKYLGFSVLVTAFLFGTTAVSAAGSLESILAAMPDAAKARYSSRHPLETLKFFGIKPGMTVVESFPGGGWYSKILAPYLGNEGHLIGADYAIEMYPKFNFYDEAYLEAKKSWVQTWTAEAEGWRAAANTKIGAFHFGSMPGDINGTVDAFLFIRAFHNLARFESDGAYMSAALGDVKRALKSGGVVGVVQHMAPEGNSDEWANGSNGYLKKSFVIKTFTDAGFELVGESAVNENPLDVPNEKDFVWRLPPTFYGIGDDPEVRKKNAAIGETTRMTLLFRKP